MGDLKRVKQFQLSLLRATRLIKADVWSVRYLNPNEPHYMEWAEEEEEKKTGAGKNREAGQENWRGEKKRGNLKKSKPSMLALAQNKLILSQRMVC